MVWISFFVRVCVGQLRLWDWGSPNFLHISSNV